MKIDIIESIFHKYSELLDYVPSNVKFKYLPISLLFAIIKEVKPSLYDEIWDAARTIQKKKKEKKLVEFKLKLAKEMAKNLRVKAKPVIEAKEFKSTFVKSRKRKRELLASLRLARIKEKQRCI